MWYIYSPSTYLQNIAKKIGSALAAPNLSKGLCARKASAEDFGICARYAPDRFLAGLLFAALNDLAKIHDRARHIYQNIVSKSALRWLLWMPVKGCAPAKAQPKILGYAPGMRQGDFWLGSIIQL